MPALEIKSGEKTLCQELNTGKGYAGFFYFDEKSIEAEICSYDEFFHIKSENPIFLRTENNYIVSLHSNIGGPPGSHSRNIEPKMQTHKLHVISNIAVIGHDRWEEKDKLKRVVFEIKHSDDFLKHKNKFQKLAQGKMVDEYETDIFSETINGITIRSNYKRWYSIEFKTPKDIKPYIEIEFEEGATLFEYLKHVMYLIQFFSLSMGIYMKPSNIRCCRLSRDEMIKAVEKDAYAGDYSIEYVWPEVPISNQDVWVGGSLARAWDDDELSSLKACIVVWMKRQKDWQKSNIQMMHALTLKQEISAERILTACKWFEEIPLTKAQAVIGDDHAKDIAEFASKKAQELGYKDIKSRVIGALKAIKTESHDERFLRLANIIKNKFDLSFINDKFISHLKKAIEFRGKAAHGHYNPSNEEEFILFAQSIYAMEVLCFLLTASDLPINEEGLKRVNSNPFVRDYRLSG